MAVAYIVQMDVYRWEDVRGREKFDANEVDAPLTIQMPVWDEDEPAMMALMPKANFPDDEIRKILEEIRTAMDSYLTGRGRKYEAGG